MLNANQLADMEIAMEEEHRRDREALQRLKRFLAPANGNGHAAPLVVYREIELEQPDHLSDFVAAEEDAPQSIIDKVEEIMQADPTKKWTVPSMVAYLKYIHFPLLAKKPAATMGLVFAKLAYKRKTIRIVKKGSGRNPNWFRANPTQLEAVPGDAPKHEQAAS
jgi:hypothetical protein